MLPKSPPKESLVNVKVDISEEQLMAVNGQDLELLCQNIAQDIENGNLEVVVIDDTSHEGEQLHVSPLPNSDSVVEKTKSMSKPGKSKCGSKCQPAVKTEPANAWIQFCRYKKNQAIVERGNKKASYNQKEAQEEWKGMPEEERAFFINLAQVEKASLGNNFRVGRVRKKKKEVVKVKESMKKGGKAKRLEAKVVVQNEKRVNEDLSVETVDFLENLEILDEEIESLEVENIALAEILAKQNVDLNVNQCKLHQLNIEFEKTSEKYNTLVKQHTSCKD